MKIKYTLTDNKGRQHRVDKDVWVHFTHNRIPLSSLAAGYAVFYQGTGKRGGVLLHRFVANAKDPDVVDHINRDILDSRRCNLRIVDRAANVRNSSARAVTGFKGVVKHRKGYAVYVREYGRNKNLGSFVTPEAAAKVWDAYQIKQGRTEFLNFGVSSTDYIPSDTDKCSGRRRRDKYRGVRYLGNRYEAQATLSGRCTYLGSFESAEDAAKAYDSFVKANKLPLSRLNFR